MDINYMKESMTNHKPDEKEIEKIENVREGYKNLLDILYKNCNKSREFSISITNLETSLMYATKSIILDKFRNE